MGKSTMTFKSYRVDKIQFIRKETEANKKFKITPTFYWQQGTPDNDNSIHITKLGCKLFEDIEEAPFSIDITVMGIFEITEGEGKEDLSKYNTLAVLFPYLRASLSQVLSISHVKPIDLPLVNIMRLVDDAEQNAKKE